jgi:hypothetical protein
MGSKMKKTIIFLFSFLVIFSSVNAQTADTLYNLTAYGGLGYVRNVTSFDYEYASLNRNGFLANLRVMWKPDYLIRAGFEVGRTDVYSINETNLPTEFGTTDLKTDVYAWSMMAIFSMSPFKNFEVNLGTGHAFTTVNNTSFGNESTSTDGGSCFMLSTGYYFPVSKDLQLGGELRGIKINKYDDYLISLQVSLAYKFLEW